MYSVTVCVCRGRTHKPLVSGLLFFFPFSVIMRWLDHYSTLSCYTCEYKALEQRIVVLQHSLEQCVVGRVAALAGAACCVVLQHSLEQCVVSCCSTRWSSVLSVVLLHSLEQCVVSCCSTRWSSVLCRVAALAGALACCRSCCSTRWSASVFVSWLQHSLER